MKRTRTVWTKEEISQITENHLRLFKTESPSLKTLRHAQKVLPKERQRPMITISAFKDLCKGITKAIEEPEEIIPQIKEVPVPAALSETPIQELLMEVGRRMFQDLETIKQDIGLLKSHFNLFLANGDRSAIPEQPILSESQIPKVRVKRVCLIGPLTQQFREMELKFKNHPLELYLLDKDKKPDRNGLPTSPDAYIVDQKFCNHSWINNIRTFCKEYHIPCHLVWGLHATTETLREISISA
jgi:hypothetical protein